MSSCRLGPECETLVGEICKDPLCENSRLTYVEQVGGTHYQSKSGYQHWDWAIDVKLPYLEGQATKYISRARKKLGLEDLRKGLSFIDKMLKCYPPVRVLSVDHVELLDRTRRFAKANALSNVEYHVCLGIAGWQSLMIMQTARTLVGRMIEDAETKPVLLTDSNKHAQEF